MSQQRFLEFLLQVRGNPAMLARYNPRNLSQLLFHAKNDGFEFTALDMENVVGPLEANVILNKDGESISGDSSLWREMWGKYHLEYIIDAVLARYSDEELWALIGVEKQRAAI